MMRVCKRYTINEDEATESMNSSFLKVLQKLNTIKDIETLPAWVKQVSINTAIDFYRAKKRYTDRNCFTLDNEFSPVENQHTQYDFTESRIDSREIFNSIQELPDTTREVLNLFAIDGFSHREVAQMLSISEEASRWHLHKARKLMNDKLQQMNYSTYTR